MVIRAQALERALPVVAGFIMDTTKIPVVRGDRAWTDGKAIYLPRLPEMDLDERDLAKAVAYLYHESGHILHSDFSLSAKTPLEKAITGILEDIRIEGLVMRRFPAARRYFGRLVEILVEDGQAGKFPCFAQVPSDAAEPKVLQAYMLYKLRHEVLGQKSVKPVLDTAVKAAEDKFPISMRTKLDALMFEVVHCDSESEVFALAAEIVKMIKEEKEKEEEEQRQQGKSDPGQDGQGQGQADPSQESEGDQSVGSSGGGGTSQGAQDGSQGKASTESNGGEEQSEAPGQVGGTGAGGICSGLDQLLSMGAGEISESIGEMMEQALNQVSAEAKWDRSSIMMPNAHRMKLNRSNVDMAKVRASINAIRTKTLSWMSSASESDKHHTQAGMKLDFPRLHAAPLGGDIFVREDEGIDLNAAVSILIDRSGSMSSCIQSAAYSAMATMLAFDVPGIETQVTVFPSCRNDDGEEGVAVIKRWEESSRDLAGRIASLGVDGGTPMAEAILWAVANMARREETLRVVVVVTDGHPNVLEAAQAIVAKARTEGIAVVGLGIGVDPSQVFGERHSAMIRDIGELSGAMVRLIRSSMADTRQ